jgi:hypothetical protein
MEMSKDFLTKAEFARVCKVSKPAVGKWVQQGLLVLRDGKVDVTASARSMASYRRDGIPKGLQAFLSGDAAAAAAAEPPRRSARPATSLTATYRRDDLIARLLKLDWIRPYSSAEAGEAARLRDAAAAVGLELATSEKRDDGHWGGYQLRNSDLVQRYGGVRWEVIAAGYGFELDEFDVLYECRDVLCHPDGAADDIFALDLALLPALAYPHGPMHRPPAPDRSST